MIEMTHVFSITKNVMDISEIAAKKSFNFVLRRTHKFNKMLFTNWNVRDFFSVKIN